MVTPKTLAVKELSKHFTSGNQTIELLCGINSEWEQGVTYGIAGPSGCGKTTFLHLITGLDKPSLGSVWYNDRNITTLSSVQQEQWRAENLGIMFQYPYLIKELSVIENVMLPGLILGKPDAQVREHAMELLKQVLLKDKAHNCPSLLSGGEQQRVTLARALCNSPAFLIADEPTAHLDKKTAGAIIDVILDMSQEYNMGLILVSHDTNLLHKCRYTTTLEGGTLHAYYEQQ